MELENVSQEAEKGCSNNVTVMLMAKSHGEYFTHVVIVIGVVDKGLKLGVMSPSNGEETSKKNMKRNPSAMKFVMVCVFFIFY